MTISEKTTALRAFGHEDTFTAFRAPGVRQFALGVDGHKDALTLTREGGVRGVTLRIGGRTFGLAFGKRRA